MTAGALLVLGLPTLAAAEEVPVDPATVSVTQTDATDAAAVETPSPPPEAPPAEPASPPTGEPSAEVAGQSPSVPAPETPPAETPADTPPAAEPPAETPPADEQPPADDAGPPPAEAPVTTAPTGDTARTGSEPRGEGEDSKAKLTVSKKVSSVQPLGDAGWRVDYTVTVKNDGRYATRYDLTDSLDRFGAGIRVDAANWTGPNGSQGDWTNLPDDLETQLADRVQIAAGARHDYTVRAFATVTQDAFDDGTWKCEKHEKKSGGFRNSVTLEFAGGWRTASACATPEVAELTLVKHVDNTPFDGLPVDVADAADWLLLAETDDLQRVEATGNEQGVSLIVAADTWNLSEIVSPGSTNPLVPDWYAASEWSCGRTPVTEGGSVTLKAGHRTTCTITNTGEPDVSLELVKSHQLPPGSGDAVEAGDEFAWQVTITNHGMPVTGLTVGDDIDAQLEQTGLATFEPAAGWTQVSEVTDPEFSATFSGLFDTGDVVTIFIPVRMLEADPVQTPPAVGPDDPAPVLPPLDDSPLPNEACVAVPGWVDAPTCDGDEIPVKRLDAGAYVRCVNDVPWLYYSIQTTDSVAPGPVTVTWTSGDGTLTKEETIPVDALTGRLLWPGAAVDANGIPYQWPGWRPLTEQDLTTPPVPGERFLDLILDETVPTYPWRDLDDPARITFTVNPSQTVLALYPMVMPSCEIERPAELVIDKTSSVTNAAPGSNFSYTLQVSSVGTGAAEPVELVDEIPSDLRVDSIATAPEPAFPRWDNCSVSGQNSAGYGGTLRCDLLGVLGPNLPTAPPVTLSVHLNEGTTATSVVNTGEVCWGEAPGDETPDVVQCAEDSVTVTVPHAATPAGGGGSGSGKGLAKSGFDGAPLLWAGGALLLVGGLAMTLALRRRRGGISE